MKARCAEDGCHTRVRTDRDHLCGDTLGKQTERGCGQFFCHEDLYSAGANTVGWKCITCLEKERH